LLGLTAHLIPRDHRHTVSYPWPRGELSAILDGPDIMAFYLTVVVKTKGRDLGYRAALSIPKLTASDGLCAHDPRRAFLSVMRLLDYAGEIP